MSVLFKAAGALLVTGGPGAGALLVTSNNTNGAVHNGKIVKLPSGLKKLSEKPKNLINRIKDLFNRIRTAPNDLTNFIVLKYNEITGGITGEYNRIKGEVLPKYRAQHAIKFAIACFFICFVIISGLVFLFIISVIVCLCLYFFNLLVCCCCKLSCICMIRFLTCGCCCSGEGGDDIGDGPPGGFNLSEVLSDIFRVFGSLIGKVLEEFCFWMCCSSNSNGKPESKKSEQQKIEA